MRRGNLVALLFQFPFFVTLAVLMRTPPTEAGKGTGFLFVALTFGAIAWATSFIYLLVSNAERIENSAILVPILKLFTFYQKPIRIVLYIALFLTVVIVLFAPKTKKRLSPTMLAQSGLVVLRL